MLMRAVAAVKADKAKALDMFNKGEGGFLDRDLYVFCYSLTDFKNVASGNPNAKQLLGTDARSLKDSTGKDFGAEIIAGMQKPEGQMTEVSYLFPRPGRLVQANDHVALVGRAGGPRLCVGRQSRLDRRVGFGGDRNSDHGTGGQRDLPPHVCWAGVR
jgi:hypothetical protein